MKSLKRSSRRDRSWASWPARAWLRRLSQVVRPDVSPPTIDPASADKAGRYAASYIYDYYEFRHRHYFDSKVPLFPSTLRLSLGSAKSPIQPCLRPPPRNLWVSREGSE